MRTISKENDGNSSVLQAVIECAADGLLATDEKGKVLCYNKLYLDIWPIPVEIVETGTHQAILQYCSNYVKDPQRFMEKAMEVYTTWPPQSFDVLLLNSGRVLERYSRVKAVKGQNAVRAWSFRDVTERRRADAYTAQLAAIVKYSNDAIIVKDLDGIITNWNPGAE